MPTGNVPARIGGPAGSRLPLNQVAQRNATAYPDCRLCWDPWDFPAAPGKLVEPEYEFRHDRTPFSAWGRGAKRRSIRLRWAVLNRRLKGEETPPRSTREPFEDYTL